MRKTATTPTFALVFIWRFQMVWMGRKKITTSVMMLNAPMAMKLPTWSPQVPGTVGSYVAANGRQMRKTCRTLPTVHSSTNAMTNLVLLLSPRLTNMRR